MDPRLLRYYNQELRYLREAGGEFAREFPKIASRLGMEGIEVSDPYVERLLEGCAFLAARIQLKQDAEFPRFSQRLLELLYPNFLAPVPSMLVAQVAPVLADPNLLKGPEVPRDSVLLATPPAHTKTRCEFRTAQALQLTPLTTLSAEYFLNVSDLDLSHHALSERPRCGVRVRLGLPAGMRIDQLEIEHLRFFLGGQTDVALRLHELLMSSCVGVLVGTPGRSDTRRLLQPESVAAVGYADEEAMLPVNLRGLSGTRLLQEYLAFPSRFLFFDLHDMRPLLAGMRGSSGQELELNFLFTRPGDSLNGAVEAGNFCLHCVPAINLFPKRADRIHVDEEHYEFQVVPDRTAPLDFEVYEVVSLRGYDSHGDERRFLPLFAPDHSTPTRQTAYYSVWREPRLLSEKARRDGPRSGYIGSEVFVSLVDPEDAPYPANLTQLAVQTRCTNRDLPVFIGSSGASSEMNLDAGMPVQGVRAIAGPSRPHTALREGGVAWNLLNLLSLNYLSLLDAESGERADGGGEGAAALRDLLSRFPLGGEPAQRRQIEALQQVRARPVVRRHPTPGPIAFSRGIEIELVVDELGHEGGSALLFGAALHHYLARHASMNSFVETVLVSLTRGEIMRWRPALGRRAVR